MTLELAPGSVIDERELIERLGLGRTPMREAVRTLAQRAARRRLPAPRHRSSRRSTSRDLGGLAEVRPAARELAARARRRAPTPADAPSLEQLLASSTRVGGDERSLIDLDQRIHRHVHRCAHNPFLESALERVLRAQPAHLVSRARPRCSASTTRSTSIATCWRRSATATATARGARHARATSRLRARDPRVL